MSLLYNLASLAVCCVPNQTVRGMCALTQSAKHLLNYTASASWARARARARARPGPGESLFSSKRLLEPIEGLIVVDIVSWQTVAFGIKVSDGERNDPRNVGHVEMSRLL